MMINANGLASIMLVRTASTASLPEPTVITSKPISFNMAP